MMAKFNAIIRLILLLSLAAPTTHAEDAVFSETILPFKQVKYFDQSFDAKTSTLNITIYKTNSSEIESLYNYDPNVINRVIIKDDSNGDVKITIVLKAKKLRAIVYSFKEPFRIVIDIFNKAQETGRKNNLVRQDDGSNRYRLLSQSKVDALSAVNQKQLDNINSGLAKGWAQFPLYIYRNFNIAFDKRKTKVKLEKNTARIAEEANKYFQYGDENKALYLYKTLLYRYSEIFNHHPEHLWNVAEIYLGHKKIYVAKSYYLSLIEKFPGTDYANYAKLRIADISSIDAIEKNNLDLLPSLVNELSNIDNTDTELEAEKLIREVYWKQNIKADYNGTTANGFMPKVDYNQYSKALALRTKIIHPKTKFLLDTIVTSFQLSDEYKWTKQTLAQILTYARNYENKENGSFSQKANVAAMNRLRQVINDQYKSKNYTNVVEIYDSIPQELAKKPNDYQTSWALANSYDKTNMYMEAGEMYEHTAILATNDSDILKSYIYSLESYKSAEGVQTITSESDLNSDINKRISQIDVKTLKEWTKSRSTTKQQIYNLFKSQLLENLKSPKPLKSYLKILSDTWNAPLQTAETISDNGDVEHLILLREKLSANGMKKEANKTQKTLLKLNAESINSSLENEDIWATEMSKYANDLRLDDRYYESAQAYKEVADKTRNWVNRAESYYKSGLLFYKAGKRSEAVAAFEKASNIKDSSLYSKLAQDRLDQIQE